MVQSKEEKFMAIAGLITGIVTLVVTCFFANLASWFGVILSIIVLPAAITGLVLSVKAGKKQKSGVATAGLVVGIIAVVLASICFISCGVCGIIALVAKAAGTI